MNDQTLEKYFGQGMQPHGTKGWTDEVSVNSISSQHAMQQSDWYAFQILVSNLTLQKLIGNLVTNFTLELSIPSNK